MPLHNIAFDEFNKEHQDANDGIGEEVILYSTKKIETQMYTIALRKEYFEDDLARHIARIANLSRKLGYKLRAEKRNMTRQEAYVQMGHSASLLKAVLKRYNKTNLIFR
jgi:high-affinity nickel permease